MIGMKVHGIDQTILSLRHVRERVVDKARKTMHRAADRIVVRAADYAPEKTGALAESIDFMKSYEAGSGRLVIEIGIDTTKGERLEKYAMQMHEGEYKLGENSLAKDAGRGVVGPRFLVRAADVEEQKLEAVMVAAIEGDADEVI